VQPIETPRVKKLGTGGQAAIALGGGLAFGMAAGLLMAGLGPLSLGIVLYALAIGGIVGMALAGMILLTATLAAKHLAGSNPTQKHKRLMFVIGAAVGSTPCWLILLLSGFSIGTLDLVVAISTSVLAAALAWTLFPIVRL
jgi:hypothetical protein